MGFLRRIAFYVGMATGVAVVVAAGTVVLTYLFTGRFPSVAVDKGKPAPALKTPAEIVEQIREQVSRARAAAAEEDEGDGQK